MNTLNRYNDKVFAWHYDYGERDAHFEDFDYYAGKLKSCQDKILELGCGTGRVTIPLKKAGINIVGLDQAKAMIEIARKKAAKKGLKISFIISDALTFKSHTKFCAIVFPYNSICQVADKDIPALIDNVKYHLHPGGRFIFDISRPSLPDKRLPRVKYTAWSDPLFIQELGVSVRRESTTVRRPEKHLLEISYHWEITHKDRRVEKRKTSMSFSTRPDEWYIEQFEKNGFKLIDRQVKIDDTHKIPKSHSFVELQL
ncbi:MAG: class I SAM-dependent methyltransferase [Patescibacteria group bacterium]